jgi:hypothetical protein
MDRNRASMALYRVVLELLPMGALCHLSIANHLFLLSHMQFVTLSLSLHHFNLTSFPFPGFSFTFLIQHRLR